MSETAIVTTGLGKLYRIGRRDERPDTLAGVAASWLRAPLDNFRRLRALTDFRDGDSPDILWALRDVSFEVAPGEVVGVIGRNGAGKTTLLKVLARITEPSAGRAEVAGRVGSLLEVGTGFHQELTGRENLYLNGTILGMTRAEIDAKLDEIVAFSGIDRFLDTPVKWYSSGMKVRLAFSVAAHLEPEILLIDEVLAVGDLEFQRKCLGKMQSVAAAGRTVLFVSHQLGMVKSLCHSLLVLEAGRVAFRGELAAGMEVYSRSLERPETAAAQPGGEGWTELSVNSSRGTCSLGSGEPLEISATLDVGPDAHAGTLLLILTSAAGDQIVHDRHRLESLTPGRFRVTVDLPGLWLAPGFYSLVLKLLLESGRPGSQRLAAAPFVLDVSGDHLKTGKRSTLLAPATRWVVRPAEGLAARPSSP